MKLSTPPNALIFLTLLSLSASHGEKAFAEGSSASAGFAEDLGNPDAWEDFSNVIKGGRAARLKAAEEEAARKLAAQTPPLQELAAKVVSVYTLPEAAQAAALREVLAQNADVIVALSSEKMPASETLNQKLWSKLPNVPEPTRNTVNEFLQAMKGDSFRAVIKNVSPAAIKAIPLAKFEKVLALGRQELPSLKISDHPGFQRILDPKGGLKIEDESMRKVAEDLMPKFFDNLGLKIKARIAAGVLRLPANATSSQQASAVLQNSGPLVQKLFQLMGDQTDSKELAEVMALLKENIQPIEQKQILAALNHRFGAEGVKKYFANISGPKKSGSVGQVHFATDTKTGEKIVVKVRRPGVVEDLALEAIAMNEAAKGTDLAPFAEKIVSNVGKELDFREESKNLVEGALYVDANRGIGIAKIIDHVPVQEDVLVMQLAPGASVAKFTSPEDLVKRGQAVTSLLEDWVKHSVSQSGFFHGDLHAGNIFLDTSVKNKQGYQLTLIDFGNAGRITREEQAGFIKLLSGIVFKSPEDVASAFESIGSVPEANRAALLAELKEILKRETTYPIHQWFNDILQDIGKAALTNKVDVPESFLAFQRGKKFLENELDLVNRLLDEADPAKKLPRFDPTWAQVKSLLKETQHNAAASLLGKQKPDSMLSLDLLKDIFKIWRNSPYRSHIKSVCQRYYRALGQLPY